MSPLLLIVCGLLLMRNRLRLAQALAWSGVVALMLCSLPMSSQLLIRIIRIPSGLNSRSAAAAQAIVVLAGGRQVAPEYGGETISALTLERVRYGAKLARERHLPLLLSGGTVYRGVPESLLMDRALQQSFATRARWVEQRSRDTHQNARYSAMILKSAGIHTVLLVTHDFHQRRSIAEFQAAGIEAVCAPVTTVALATSDRAAWQIPNALSFSRNVLLLHEILGNLVVSPGRD
jgi:uncharacterized SAM-binding protein YcdF (DUF218 family)